MAKQALLPLLWLVMACEANVVDAVREPPKDTSQPQPPSPLVSLLHRYSFTEEGAKASDLKGAAHATIEGTTAPGDGTLPLAGAGEFVTLPPGIIKYLTAATFEAWFTWNGGKGWQRIFDFGNNHMRKDGSIAGTSYLFLTPASATDINGLPPSLRVSYSQNDVGDEDVCNGPTTLPPDVETYVAVVVNPKDESISLYVDGEPVKTCPLTRPLSAINDVNAWLGHSNFSADADFNGTFDEFRIYGAALTSDEIAESFRHGPNAMP